MDYFVAQEIGTKAKPVTTKRDYSSLSGIVINILSTMIYMCNY